MANWIRLGTAQEEAVAAQDAATRAERAENAVRNAANALTEIVATLQELADEYQTKALQVALQHALDTKDKAHEALTAAEHASFGAFNAFDATQAELYALREWAQSWSGFVTPEVVGGYYARIRTIAGKIAALATETSPDDFPHDREPLPEGFAPLPHVDPPSLGGEWTGQVLQAIEFLDPVDAIARRGDLEADALAIRDDIARRRESIRLLQETSDPLEMEVLATHEAALADLEATLGELERKLHRIFDSPERITVYSHPDELSFGWWRTAPEWWRLADLRFDTFTSGEHPFPAVGVQALAGTATYEGPSAGVYVERPPGAPNARNGTFAATVTLSADFEENGTISGSVSDFREDGIPLGA